MRQLRTRQPADRSNFNERNWSSSPYLALGLLLSQTDDIFRFPVEPMADGGFGLLVDMGIDIHGNLDGRMTELLLNILEVKLPRRLRAFYYVLYT